MYILAFCFNQNFINFFSNWSIIALQSKAIIHGIAELDTTECLSAHTHTHSVHFSTSTQRRHLSLFCPWDTPGFKSRSSFQVEKENIKWRQFIPVPMNYLLILQIFFQQTFFEYWPWGHCCVRSKGDKVTQMLMEFFLSRDLGPGVTMMLNGWACPTEDIIRKCSEGVMEALSPSTHEDQGKLNPSGSVSEGLWKPRRPPVGSKGRDLLWARHRDVKKWGLFGKTGLCLRMWSGS